MGLNDSYNANIYLNCNVCMTDKEEHYLYLSQELLTVEGRIVSILGDGERMAGEIYALAKASQSTVSRKIARMVDQGLIECRTSPTDRRVPIYRLADGYRRFLRDRGAEDAISTLGVSIG